MNPCAHCGKCHSSTLVNCFYCGKCHSSTIVYCVDCQKCHSSTSVYCDHCDKCHSSASVYCLKCNLCHLSSIKKCLICPSQLCLVNGNHHCLDCKTCHLKKGKCVIPKGDLQCSVDPFEENPLCYDNFEQDPDAALLLFYHTTGNDACPALFNLVHGLDGDDPGYTSVFSNPIFDETNLSLKCTECSKSLAYTFAGESFFPDAFKGKSKGGKNDPKTPQAADQSPPAKKIKF